MGKANISNGDGRGEEIRKMERNLFDSTPPPLPSFAFSFPSIHLICNSEDFVGCDDHRIYIEAYVYSCPRISNMKLCFFPSLFYPFFFQ